MKTIEEIRRERLAMLREESGGVGKMAERLEKSPSQVSQWINGSANSGTGKSRGISDDACRDLEEKYRKPRGWMDADPAKVDAIEMMRLINFYLQSTEEGRRQILVTASDAEKIRIPKLALASNNQA